MKNKISAILLLNEDGTKLQPLTRMRPIASLPFGCRYRLIDFPFSSLYSAEIDSAALFIGGSGRSLYDHIRSGHEWGLDSTIGGGVFTFSQLEMKSELDEHYTGQLGYSQNQIDYVTRSRSEYTVVMGSKMLCMIDIDALLRYHIEKEAEITLVYKNVPKNFTEEETADRCFVIDSGNEGLISGTVNVSEVPDDAIKMALSMNIAIMRSDKFIEYVKEAERLDLRGNLAALFDLAIDQERAAGYEYTGYLKNINNIQSYYEANMEMLEEINYNALFNRTHPVVTKSKNGSPTFYSKTANVRNVQLASDCIIEGNVEDSLIFRKVKILQQATVKKSIIMQGSKIDKGAYLEYVILDKDVYIGPGVHLKGTAQSPLVIEKHSSVTEEKGAEAAK